MEGLWVYLFNRKTKRVCEDHVTQDSLAKAILLTVHMHKQSRAVCETHHSEAADRNYCFRATGGKKSQNSWQPFSLTSPTTF